MNNSVVSGSESKGFADSAAECFRENERFLLREARDVINEATELANDSIDYIGVCLQRKPEQAMHFFGMYVLGSTSYSVFTNLLAGALPTCFRELRFLLETLAKCYVVDKEETDFDFPKDRQGKRRAAEITVVRKFDTYLNLGDKSVDLWQSLSGESHTEQFVKRVIDNILERDNLPTYAMPLPMTYTRKELDELNELRDYIVRIREIMKVGLIDGIPDESKGVWLK